MANAKEAFAQAVCLLAAANTPHSLVDLPDWPHESDLFPNCLATARAQLDEVTFATAWEQGCTLSTEAAVIYALSIVQ